MEQREIFAIAQKLVDAHGSAAIAHAALELDARQSSGDAEGEAIWRQVISYIEDIRRTEACGSIVSVDVTRGPAPKKRRKPR